MGGRVKNETGEVLEALQEPRVTFEPDGPSWDDSGTLIENGHFVVLEFLYELLPGASFPDIDGLLIKDLLWNGMVPMNIQLLPHLTEFGCMSNQLTELKLSGVPNLTRLHCGNNQLTKLDLSRVPNLTDLCCWGNRLTELDLSPVPSLTSLMSRDNKLTELDVRHLRNLRYLRCDEDVTIVQGPDQNFK